MEQETFKIVTIFSIQAELDWSFSSTKSSKEDRMIILWSSFQKPIKNCFTTFIVFSKATIYVLVLFEHELHELKAKRE